MNLKKELTENLSLSLVKKIEKYIGNDQNKFDQLMKFSLTKDSTLSPHASWAAIHTAEKNLKLLNKWVVRIVDFLENDIHPSVKRNLLRLLQDISIPEDKQSHMFDIGLKLMLSVKEPIAVRVFAMTVLVNIAEQHPDLINELETCIYSVMEEGASPAIRARGKNSLKRLAKYKGR